jgi:hypothetical protein
MNISASDTSFFAKSNMSILIFYYTCYLSSGHNLSKTPFTLMRLKCWFLLNLAKFNSVRKQRNQRRWQKKSTRTFLTLCFIWLLFKCSKKNPQLAKHPARTHYLKDDWSVKQGGSLLGSGIPRGKFPKRYNACTMNICTKYTTPARSKCRPPEE